MDDKFSYKPVTDADIELFNKHKDAINAAVRSKISSVPADFDLKPVRIALPENKFVKISFLTGGAFMRPPDQPDWKPPGPTISVDDSIKSTPDEE
ncbi:unnamed protein product [Rotaria sp. Silwood2]|nr:unnamed protein product [Rotaria sp. Silwood2]CAF4489644.1 unnamed protein product [Rotaria sp. Silwood2]